MTKAKNIRGMHDLIGEDFLSQKEIIKLFESVRITSTLSL